MATSPKGVAFIKSWEKLSLVAYQDSGKVWTIGYGATGRGIGPGTTWNHDQACEALFKRLKVAEREVDNAVNVVVNQPQFDAMVSLAYNIGGPTFASSSVVRFINRHLFQLASDSFKLFCMDNGKVIRGLLDRRRAESAMFDGLYSLHS